jgi:integrase
MANPVSINPCKHPRYAFRVTFANGGDRGVKYFKTKTAATEFAREKRIELLNLGVQDAEITKDERAAVIRARELATELAEHGATFNLADAVEFYREYVLQSKRSVRLLEAYDCFYATREAERCSEGHLRNFKYCLQPFAKRHAKRLVCDISAPDIDRWIQGMKKAPETRKNHKTLLNNFFGFCLTKGWAAANPVATSAKVVVPPSEVGVLTPKQTADLLNACDPEIVAAVALAAFAGVRREEIARLTWDNINLQTGCIVLSSSITKSASRRIVTIEPNLAKWLRPVAKESGKIRPTEQRFRTRWEAAREAAGIDPWPKNALRHSFASYHLARGQNAAATALQLGHADSSVLFAHYLELVQKPDAERYFAIVPTKKSRPKSRRKV